MTIFWVILVLQALICGFLSMDLAEKKGYSSGTWLAIGLFFGIFGLIAAAGLPRKQVPMSASVLLKKCPDCAESIRKEALVCKFCGANFSKEQVITELVQALQENYTAATLEVLEAFRTTHDDSVVPHLIRFIDAVGSQIDYIPPDLEVRLLNKAGQLLIDIGSPAISQELVLILKKGGTLLMKEKIIEILGSLRDPSCVPVLIESLRQSSLSQTSASALEKLGEAALPHLEHLVKDGKRSDRKLAEQIIARIKSSPMK